MRVKFNPPQRRAKLDRVSAIAVLFCVVDRAYHSKNHDPVITSGVDGKHSPTSLHYAGAAWDFGVHGISEDDRAAIAGDINTRLGTDFDVIYEGAGTPNAHIHVEWQPRG